LSLSAHSIRNYVKLNHTLFCPGIEHGKRIFTRSRIEQQPGAERDPSANLMDAGRHGFSRRGNGAQSLLVSLSPLMARYHSYSGETGRGYYLHAHAREPAPNISRTSRTRAQPSNASAYFNSICAPLHLSVGQIPDRGCDFKEAARLMKETLRFVMTSSSRLAKHLQRRNYDCRP
jgi:hypothetical protein